MKSLFFWWLLLIFTVSFTACETAESKKHSAEQAITSKAPESLKKIEVNIEGMTCEIGCARLIESKLSKTNGIKFVDVNFEKKLGQIEYDENTINPQQIADVVKHIAGGDLYKITNTKSVNEFSTIE